MMQVDRIFRDDNSDGVWDYMFENHKWLDQNGNVDMSLSYTDEGADGLDSRAITDNVYDSGGKLQISATDNFNTNAEDSRHVNHYYYDEQERYAGEHFSYDQGMDGTLDQQSWVTRIYDDAGRILSTTIDKDYDSDGDDVVDATEVETYAYNPNGQTTMIDWSTYYSGQIDQTTHVTYQYEYNSNGLVEQLSLPSYDPDASDVVWRYSYDSAGRLKNVMLQHEDWFGDNKFHNDETYKYNKSGQLIEANKYDVLVNDKNVLEAKTKLDYWGNGLLKSETTTGQDWDWKTITGVKDEYWYTNDDKLDTQLTSYDLNGDGQYEAGTRTLEQWAYNNPDGSMSAHTIDYNTGDGVIEYEFSSLLA